MDIDLLLAVKNKNNYQRFKPYVQEHVLSKEVALVFNTVESYFNAFPATTDIDWTAFESYFFLYRNSQIKREATAAYKAIFDKLKTTTATATLETVLAHYVTQDYAHRIAEKALEVKDNKASIDDVGELVAKHDKELGRAINPADLFVTGGIAGVLAEAAAPGYDWRLNELNISCGPLRRGDFILVAAFVETGKTTFAASEISHMATQIKDNRPVVWVNNEERSDKVLLRIMQAALGMTLKDIQADPVAAQEAYDKMMGMPNRILVLSNDSGLNNTTKLTPLFRDVNPAIIVFDQLDKVDIPSYRDENDATRIGRKYNWARNLAHEYGPVLAISQTDASSEGDQYIRMNQLRGSKVDKPGEADAIITIGKDNDKARPNVRYLHVPKNKLFGGAVSDEAYRHGYWEVSIDPTIARYEGVK